MAKNVNFSICLTDIGEAVKAGHGSISISDKNGKKYAQVTMWVNDTPDQFGNDLSFQLNSRTAGDRKVYVGNAKQPDWMKGEQAAPAQQTRQQTEQNVNDMPDDLPF